MLGAFFICVFIILYGDIMKNTDSIATYTTEPHIELIGSTELIINGLKGIGEYTSERIRIDLGGFIITIHGDELFINSFTHSGAIINGTILGLELSENG